MSDAAVALQAVAAGVKVFAEVRMDVIHRGLVAAHAVRIDGIPAVLGNLDVRRIVAEDFMLRIDHAGPPFLHEVDGDVLMRQVAVRALELAVRRVGKCPGFVLHGVARAAECRRARDAHHGAADAERADADGKSAREAQERVLLDEVSKFHVRFPPFPKMALSALAVRAILAICRKANSFLSSFRVSSWMVP